MAKLKLFRTAIGFHDAYVAAPSRKAALAAWGSDKDLFARGVAEEVADQTLGAEALATPGKVIKRLRGTEAEQIAALPDPKPRAKKAPAETSSPKPPRPSRVALEKAEQALAKADTEFAQARRDLIAREAKLARERRELEKAEREDRARLELARDEAADAFDTAMRRWRT